MGTHARGRAEGKPLLVEAQLDQYQRDGIVFPLPVLSAEEARFYRSSCDELEKQLGGSPRTVEVRQMHLHFRWAYDLAVHPRVVEAVRGVLGPDLLVWATELFAKHPQDDVISIGWHRDEPYMGFDSALTATAWVALSPSTRANGCMQVVYNSDRQESDGNSDANVPEDRVRDVTLKAGEMSLHDVNILHGSGPNHSDEKRVGFAIRFITPEARPLAGRPQAILACGEDRHNHFQLAAPPSDLGTEAALREMKNSAAEHLHAMLHNLKEVAKK